MASPVFPSAAQLVPVLRLFLKEKLKGKNGRQVAEILKEFALEKKTDLILSTLEIMMQDTTCTLIHFGSCCFLPPLFIALINRSVSKTNIFAMLTTESLNKSDSYLYQLGGRFPLGCVFLVTIVIKLWYDFKRCGLKLFDWMGCGTKPWGKVHRKSRVDQKKLGTVHPETEKTSRPLLLT